MEIEPKDGAYWLGLAATGGGMWAWVRNLGRRVRAMEMRMTNENGEPLILTYVAHDIICKTKTEAVILEMRHVTESVKALTEVVEKQTEKLAEISQRVAVLDDRAERGGQ